MFESLNDHMFDSSGFNNHLFALIKCCSLCFTKIILGNNTQQCSKLKQEEVVEIDTI